MRIILCISVFVMSLFFLTPTVSADSAFGGTIVGLIVGNSSSTTAVVTFDSSNPSFQAMCPYRRVKFSKTDKELFSFVLSLYLSGKNIGFYVNPNSSLPGIPGHGVGSCELSSIWIDGA